MFHGYLLHISDCADDFPYRLFISLCQNFHRLLIRQKLFQILRCITCHQFPFGNDHNIIADFLDLCQNVRAQDHGMLFCKLSDQFTDLNDLLRIQSDRRFIQNDDLRKSKDRLRKSDSLLITFGQVLDQTVLHIHDLHHQHNLLDLLFPFLFRNLLQLRYEPQVFIYLHIRVKRWHLRQIADTFLRCLRFLQYIVPIDQHFALCGAKITGHNVHGRGFSGTVRSQKSIDLSGIYSKIQMIYSQM